MSAPDADPEAGPGVRFECRSIYGALSDRPLIEVDWPVTSWPARVSPAEARRMALVLLETANASEMDAVVYRWMRGRLGMTTEQAAQVMVDFRRIRQILTSPDLPPDSS